MRSPETKERYIDFLDCLVKAVVGYSKYMENRTRQPLSQWYTLTGKAAAEWRELRRRSRPEWACMHWWYTGMWSVECLPAPPWPIPCGLSTCPFTRPSLPPAPAGATVRFLPYNETLGACVADAKAEGADFIIGELRPSPVTVAAGSRQRGTQLQCSGLAIDGCALQAVVAGSWGRGFTSQIVQQARHVASNCSLCAVFPRPALPCSALMQP